MTLHVSKTCLIEHALLPHKGGISKTDEQLIVKTLKSIIKTINLYCLAWLTKSKILEHYNTKTTCAETVVETTSK